MKETNVSGPCVCSEIRRTARKVSALYDQALASTGLSITQHALLVNIARAGEVSRSGLAVLLGMERTTLTRNLKPLEREGLVVAVEGADRRERLLRISVKGKRRLERSYKCWEKVQRDFTSRMGVRGLAQLRKALRLAESVAAAKTR